jgi:ectoine hydroxylase-related dioxygenase (phytanoyl-CoA dioxygenase family)
MPNLLKVAPIAGGSYVLFDNSIWHSAFPNTLDAATAGAMLNHGDRQGC